jgi:hypothetical protein
MTALISRHESNPLYSAFVEQFSKDLCEGLTAVQTRKVASALSILGNTKQQEERDRASGKKKVSDDGSGKEGVPDRIEIGGNEAQGWVDETYG